MKITASPAVKKAIKLLFIGLTGIYLLFLVDIYTLNTTAKRVFIFCYFVVICSLLVHLKRYFMAEKYMTNRPEGSFVLTVALSLCVLLVWQDFFLPCTAAVQVSIEADGTGEVWLTSLERDGQEVPLDEVQIVTNVSWEYNAEYDDYVYYPDSVFENNCLQLENVGREVCLYFAKNSWSGSVRIQVEGQPDVEMNLFADEGIEHNNVYRCRTEKVYSPAERIFLNFGVFGILIFFLEFVSVWLSFKIDIYAVRSFFCCAFADGRQKAGRVKLMRCFPAALILFLFFGQTLILDDWSVPKLILFILGLLPAYIFCVVMLYALESVQKSILNKKAAQPNSISGIEPPVSLRLMSVVLAIIFTIPSLVFIGDLFLRPYQAGQIQILPLNQRGAYSDSAEVWLLDVVVDGTHLELRSLDLPQGWVLNEYGSITFLPSENVKPEPLTVSYPAASHVYVKFLHHAWSGLVLVLDGEKEEQLDLSDQISPYYYEVMGNRGAITGDLIGGYSITAVILFIFWGTVVYYLYKKIYADVNGYRQRSWIFLFLTVFSIFSLYLTICRPGFLNKDATVQWSQALELAPLTNGHPIVSTLFWRLCSKIVPSLTFVVFAQCIIISAVLASCFMILIDHGMRRKRVIIILAVLTVFPNHALLAVSATKDGLYCAFLLLMGVSLYNIMRIKRGRDVFAFASSSAMVCLLRHEGFAVVFLSGLVLVVLSFVKKSPHLGLAAVSIAILLAIGTNTVLSNLYLKNSNVSSGSSIFSHLILGVHASGGDIGEAGEKYLKTYAGDIPITDLEALFDPYNADTIGWSEYHDQLVKNAASLTRADEVVTLFDCLRNSPALTISIKLAENNLLWNVFQHSTSWHDLGGWVYYPGLGDEFGFETLRGAYAPVVQKVITATQENPITNALLWRVGFAVCIWILLAEYCLEKRRFFDMLPSVPVMLQWSVLMIVIQFQVYRYLWIALMTVVFQLIFLMESNDIGFRDKA